MSYGAAETAAVPGRHGHVDPESRRRVPAQQRDGGRIGHRRPTLPSAPRRRRRRHARGSGGLALVPHGGGDHREERTAPRAAPARLQLGEAVELGRVRAAVDAALAAGAGSATPRTAASDRPASEGVEEHDRATRARTPGPGGAGRPPGGAGARRRRGRCGRAASGWGSSRGSGGSGCAGWSYPWPRPGRRWSSVAGPSAVHLTNITSIHVTSNIRHYSATTEREVRRWD